VIEDICWQFGKCSCCIIILIVDRGLGLLLWSRRICLVPTW